MTDRYVEQVGGSHYQSEYQHWDWVVDTKLMYLEGQATKYVSRWRFKGEGLKDLRKGLSFVDKMLKCYEPQRVLPVSLGVLMEATRRWGLENKLTPTEHNICFRIAGWRLSGTLLGVRASILLLIQGAEPAPVPLTEENHYAERAAPGQSNGLSNVVDQDEGA